MATIKLETFSPSPGVISSTLFEKKLRTALTSAPSGSTVDCTTYTGNVYITATIPITRPITHIFSHVPLNYNGKVFTDMFSVYSSKNDRQNMPQINIQMTIQQPSLLYQHLPKHFIFNEKIMTIQ